MRLWTIHINLFKEREMNTMFVIHKSLNFLRGSWLLVVELVAWETQDLQSAVAHCVVHLNQLLVVRIGQPSLGDHIND